MPRLRENRRGFTLVGTMVSFALVGIVALIFAEMMSNQFKAQRGLDVIDGVRDLKNQIQTLLSDGNSCFASLNGQNPAPAYPPGTPIALLTNPAGTTQYAAGNNYEGNRVRLVSMALHDFIPSTGNPQLGVATLTLNLAPVGQTFGAQSFRRDLQLSVGLNATGTVNTCSAIGGLSDSLWQVVPSTIGTANQLIYYNAGFVGIGTSNPTAPFQVKSGGGTIRLGNGTVQTDTTGTWSGIDMYLGGANRTTVYNDWNHPGSLAFDTAGGAATQKMIITPAGNVGIGTGTPTRLLTVTEAAGTAVARIESAAGANAADLELTRIGSGVSWTVSQYSNDTFQIIKNSGMPGGLTPLTIDTAGNIGVGTTSPSATLDVHGGLVVLSPSYGGFFTTTSAAYGAVMALDSATGSMGNLGAGVWGVYCQAGLCGGAAGAWQVASDRRLKRNIQTIDHALEKILRLRGVYYNWRDPELDKTEGPKVGLIAQEVEAVFPQAVKSTEMPDRKEHALPGGTKVLAYSDLVGPVVQAIKEFHDGWTSDSTSLHDKIDSLELENAKLREAVCELNPNAKVCR